MVLDTDYVPFWQVYTWDDIDLSINSFTPSAWKIPG